jgi:ribose 1,5-bisphosphokinase PhnN
MRKTLAVPRTLTVADAHALADRLEPNGRLQSDQATAAKLIRALLANRAASDVITLQDD